MKETKRAGTSILAAVCAVLICGCQANTTPEETTVPADTDAAAAETTAPAETTAAETEKTEAPAKPAVSAEKVKFPSEVNDETAGEILNAAFANTIVSLDSAFAPDGLSKFDKENQTAAFTLTNRDMTVSGDFSQNGDTADMSLSVSDKGTGKKASFGIFCDTESAVLSLLTPDDSYCYGVNLETAEEDIKNSIFAADSGSMFAIPEDFDFSTLVPDTDKYTELADKFAEMPLTVSEEGDSIIITCTAEGDAAYELLFGLQGSSDYSEYIDIYTELNDGKEPDALLTAEFTADKTTEELISAKIDATIAGEAQTFADSGYEVNFDSGEIAVNIFDGGNSAADISITCDKSDGYSLKFSAYAGESAEANISLTSKDGKFTFTANQSGEEMAKITGTVSDESDKYVIATDSIFIDGEDMETSVTITITECGSLKKPESKPFFSITEDELTAILESAASSLETMFEDSDSALGDYIRESRSSTANSNAKLVYTNAATYATKCEINGTLVSFSSTGGSVGDSSDDEPKYDGTEADFRKAMAYYMGCENSGYFYVEFEDGYPVKTMWSEDPAFGEAAESGKDNFDESMVFGIYPLNS